MNRELTRFSKTDVRCWRARVFKQTYQRGGKKFESPNWMVEIQAHGTRHRLSLETPNKEAAAVRAKDIYLSIQANGWEAALQKYRPALAVPQKRQNVTVGEFIAEVTAKADRDPGTLADYARALRKIVADAFGVDDGPEKFDSHSGGYQNWLTQVHGIKLARLTPEKVQGWKRAFLARASTSPIEQRKAKVSVNSFIRRARCLFTPGILQHLEIELATPLPFEGVEFEPRQSLKYRSNFDVQALIIKATEELAGQESEAFKIFLLAVMVGLRRKEIDLLEWPSFRWEHRVIRVEPTKFFHPKSEDSIGDVPLDPEIVELFRGYRARATDEFVIESKGRAKPGVTYVHYRCQKQFEKLNKWLRAQGVTAGKPLHTLRKEFGSRLATTHGIHAASKGLRHADISITNAFYADSESRVTTGFGRLLTASNNVVAMPIAKKK